MIDSLYFIKDNDDYNAYLKLTPKKLYARRKVKFICSKCKKESVKTFRYLTKELICRSCQCSIIQNTQEVKTKIKNTNYQRYGVDNVFKSEQIKTKIKSTILDRYGVNNIHQLQCVIDKTKETNNERYGVNTPIQNSNILDKMQQTILNRYGVDNVMHIDTIKQKQQETLNYNWYHKYDKILSNENLIINKSVFNGFIELKCLKCNKLFNISESVFYARIKFNLCKCPLCTLKTHVIKSNAEQELYQYIASIYNGTIITNDRKVLNGKEIDIYLPDMQLGIEFDGTYWHADPRFFKPNDILLDKTAADIWQKDINKDLLAESKGIMLIRVKEYDWVHNNTEIKQVLNEIISYV